MTQSMQWQEYQWQKLMAQCCCSHARSPRYASTTHHCLTTDASDYYDLLTINYDHWLWPPWMSQCHGRSINGGNWWRFLTVPGLQGMLITHWHAYTKLRNTICVVILTHHKFLELTMANHPDTTSPWSAHTPEWTIHTMVLECIDQQLFVLNTSSQLIKILKIRTAWFERHNNNLETSTASWIKSPTNDTGVTELLTSGEQCRTEFQTLVEILKVWISCLWSI